MKGRYYHGEATKSTELEISTKHRLSILLRWKWNHSVFFYEKWPGTKTDSKFQKLESGHLHDAIVALWKCKTVEEIIFYGQRP